MTLPVRLSSAATVDCVPPGAQISLSPSTSGRSQNPQASARRAEQVRIADPPDDFAALRFEADQFAGIREYEESSSIDGRRPLTEPAHERVLRDRRCDCAWTTSVDRSLRRWPRQTHFGHTWWK